MNAREEILTRIGSGRTEPAARPEPTPRGYVQAGSRPADVEQFVNRLLDYRALVHRCAPDGVASTVGKIVGASSAVAPPGVPAPWIAGTGVVPATHDLTIMELTAIDAVVTGCALAIGETGTIVLDHGPDQGPRAMTLVPDHHIVILRTDQLVASVPDAVHHLGATPTQTWISGPSATSDIELNRVEGVHGPRTLEVVVVEI